MSYELTFNYELIPVIMYILLIHIPGLLNIHLLCTKHFVYVYKNFG